MRILQVNQKNVDKLLALMLFGGALLLYLITLCQSFANADSASYAEIIVNWRISRSVHIGFYALGKVFYEGMSRIFPVSIIISQNILSALFGALGVMFTFLWAKVITKSQMIGILGSVFLFFSGLYWSTSVFGEVYSSQGACIIASMYFLVRRRTAISAIFFALAMLISPLSALMLPYHLYHLLRSKTWWKPLSLFAGVSLAVYILSIVPVFQSYFWGGRGIFTISQQDAFSWGKFISSGKDAIKYFLESLNVLCILVVYSIFILNLKREYRYLGIVTMITIIPHVISCGKLSLDDGFLGEAGGIWYLPLYPLLTTLAACGMYEITRRMRSHVQKHVFCMIVILFLGIFSYKGVVQPHREYSDRFRKFAKQLEHTLPSNAFLLSYQDATFGALYSYYTKGKIYGGQWAMYSPQKLKTLSGQPQSLFLLGKGEVSFEDIQKTQLIHYKSFPPFWVYKMNHAAD